MGAASGGALSCVRLARPALAAGRPQSPADPAVPEGGEDETPHYYGHRERLRSRLREAGDGALADYELLELVLFRAIPRRDVKPLAKNLIAKFDSFAETITAEPGLLAEVEGMSASAVWEFKIVEAAAQRLVKGVVKKRLPMGSWREVIDSAARRWRSRAANFSGSCFSTRRMG